MPIVPAPAPRRRVRPLALGALLLVVTGGALEAGLGAHANAASAPPHTPLLTVGRLQYGGGGDWYANPTALTNLLEAVRRQTGIPTAEREVVVTPLDPTLGELGHLYLTGHGALTFTAEERVALAQWLRAGGFLHVDDNYGLDAAFRREIALVLPEAELVELPTDHPVYHVVNDFPEGLPKIHEHDGLPPRGYGMHLDGRLAVFYSHESDLGNGWEDPGVHDLPEAHRTAALNMGVNLFVYALSRRAP
jgi:hypothetical protein